MKIEYSNFISNEIVDTPYSCILYTHMNSIFLFDNDYFIQTKFLKEDALLIFTYGDYSSYTLTNCYFDEDYSNRIKPGINTVNCVFDHLDTLKIDFLDLGQCEGQITPGFEFTDEFTSSNDFTLSSDFTISSTFTTSSTFSSSFLFTLSPTFSESSLFTPLNIIFSFDKNKVSLLLSVTEVYVSARTVSFSYFQIESNIESKIIFSSSYSSITMSKIIIYTNMPYIIYTYTLSYSYSIFLKDLNLNKNWLTSEKLVGIVCGSVSMFFLILGIAIIVYRRNVEKNRFINEEYDFLSSSECSEQQVPIEKNIELHKIDNPSDNDWI